MLKMAVDLTLPADQSNAGEVARLVACPTCKQRAAGVPRLTLTSDTFFRGKKKSHLC